MPSGTTAGIHGCSESAQVIGRRGTEFPRANREHYQRAAWPRAPPIPSRVHHQRLSMLAAHSGKPMSVSGPASVTRFSTSDTDIASIGLIAAR
jgi:hypothetical protein